MEKFSNAYFKKLANQIMFDLNDEEISSLKKDFEVMLDQMQLLAAVDTENVDVMVYPFETETYFLREDTVSQILPKSEALENAPEVKDGQITVPKVVG